MVCLVVVSLVLLKDPAEQNRTCYEHKVCSDNDEDHGNKEHRKCLQRSLDHEHDSITCQKDKEAQDTYEPVCLRGLLACLIGIDKINGSREPYESCCIEEDQDEDNAVYENSEANRLSADNKLIAGFKAEHLSKAQLGKLGQADTDRKTCSNRYEPCDQCLEKYDLPEILPVHSEHAVKTEFLKSALNKRGLCIEQENSSEYRYYG